MTADPTRPSRSPKRDPKKGWGALALTACWLLCAAAPAQAFYDQLYFSHVGAADPLTADPDPALENWAQGGGLNGTSAGPIFDDEGSGIDAWQIVDPSTASGSTHSYLQTPSQALIDEAAVEGWVMEARLRLPNAPEGVGSIFFEYGTGARRFLVNIGAEADGDPIVTLVGSGDRPSITLSLDGLGGGYHLYELAYEPERDRARLLVDGEPAVESYAGFPAGGVSARVVWGAGSSAATGTAHWALVEFRTGRLGPLGGIGFCCPSPEGQVVWPDESDVHQQLHEYEAGTLTSLAEHPVEPGYLGAGMDVARGDLEGDGVGETILAYAAAGSTVVLALSSLDPLDLSRTGGTSTTLQSLGAPLTSASPTVRTRAGDLDGDDDDEIVVAYDRDDGEVAVVVFDQGPSGLTLVGESASVNEIGNLDLAVGDLDGDFVDEIVVVGRGPGSGGTARYYADVYELAAGPQLEFRNRRFGNIATGDIAVHGLSVALPDLDGDRSAEIAVGTTWRDTGSSARGLFVDVSAWSGTFTSIDSHRQGFSGTPWPVSLAVGDALGDGSEELFFASGATQAFSVQVVNLALWLEGALQASSIGGLSVTTSSFQGGVRTLGFGLDQVEGTPLLWRMRSTGEITIYELTGSSPTTLSLSVRDAIPASSASSLLAVGDFNPTVARLGAPKIRRATSLLRPLVILNAPPTHFDVDTYARPDLSSPCGESEPFCFDVNACWLDIDECEFESEYQEMNQSGTEMQLEFTRTADWGLTAGASGTVLGATVEVELEARFGSQFSQVAGSSETVTETTTVTARADDQIYGEVLDFDVWEYPVLLAGQTVDHVVSTIPQPVERGWFSSKSVRGLAYTPFHEVGNLLSYSNGPLPTGGDLVASDFIVVDTTSSLDWTVTHADFQTAGETREASWSVGATASASGGSVVGPQISVEVTGEYGQGSVASHTSTVLNEIQIETRLRNIEGPYSGYEVTPFAHWTPDGILMIDYRVDPETGGPFPLWWEQTYQLAPDPAFNLPFRLDAQKGFFSAPGQRSFTRDIRYDVADAQLGGALPFSALVRNFSLSSTPGRLSVTFSIGDPNAAGAIPLLSPTGQSEFFTSDAFVPPRGGSLVEGEWQLPTLAAIPAALLPPNCQPLAPGGVPLCLPVYAVVAYESGTEPAACSGGDPALCEVRADNNKGWILVNLQPELIPLPEPGMIGLLAGCVLLGALHRRREARQRSR